MGYLDQLKNISNVPDAGPTKPTKPPGTHPCIFSNRGGRIPTKPTKPTEPGYVGFVGPVHGVFEKSQAVESPARWLLHFADREPLTIAFSPAAPHAEVLEMYPSALAAEPIEPGRRQPDTLLAGDQEAAILAWLAQIGETDQVIVDDVLRQCRQDEEAREYYLGRAGYAVTDDDRRCCSQCGNLRSGVCTVARPGGVVSAVRGYRPSLVDVPIRCAGFVAQREART